MMGRLDRGQAWKKSGWIIGAIACLAATVALTADTARAQLGPSSLFVPATAMIASRGGATATLVPNGTILVAGGIDNTGTIIKTAEIYDPATGVFAATGSMTVPRTGHTATLLQSGQVLITGGVTTGGTPLASAELFNPATNVFTAVPSLMSDTRKQHSATLLDNGQVLIAGGVDAGGSILDTAEIYDQASNSFICEGGVSSTPPLCNSSMARQHASHTAVLLNNGNVLIAGGITRNSVVTSLAETFTPAQGASAGNGSFGSVRNMSDARIGHTATRLHDGTVLIAGGFNGADTVATAEIFNPANGRFQSTVTSSGAITVMNSSRQLHTATLLDDGTVLLAGGVDNGGSLLAQADVYVSANGQFVPSTNPMRIGRAFHLAARLNNGTVLVAGGLNVNLNAALTNQADLFDPTPGSFDPNGAMGMSRQFHTATLLSNGQTLIAGGENPLGVLATTELYDDAIFNPGPNMTAARAFHTATSLGATVLLAGGFSIVGSVSSSADLYTVASNTNAPTGTMANPRFGHSATPLPNGKVLLAGGITSDGSVLNRAELFSGSAFTLSKSKMAAGRVFHTATLIPGGVVLLAGGLGATGKILNSAEVYNPVKDSFSALSALMTDSREFHTATLLDNGRVLIAGGIDKNGPTATAEILNPATRTFTAVGPMLSPRFLHSAILLPDGNVLLAGGESRTTTGTTVPVTVTTVLNQAEIFNAASLTFTPAVTLMFDARFGHTASMLQSGFVLLTGGADDTFNMSASSELYDPPSGPSAAGVVVAPAAIAASTGKPGATVDAGGIQAFNLSGDPESVGSVTVALTNARIFSRLTLTAGSDHPAHRSQAATVTKPHGTTIFVFNPPVVIPSGGSLTLGLDGVLGAKRALPAHSIQTATGIVVSTDSGPARTIGLPAGLGEVTLR